MRASVRFAIVAFVLFSVVLFTRHFRDIRTTWDGYRAAPHHDDGKFHQPSVPDATHSHTATSEDDSQFIPTASSTTELSTSYDEGHHPTATPGSKVIVMARLESENTDWVAQDLPEYAPSFAALLPILTRSLAAGIAPFTRSTTLMPPFIRPSTRAEKQWPT